MSGAHWTDRGRNFVCEPCNAEKEDGSKNKLLDLRESCLLLTACHLKDE